MRGKHHPLWIRRIDLGDEIGKIPSAVIDGTGKRLYEHRVDMRSKFLFDELQTLRVSFGVRDSRTQCHLRGAEIPRSFFIELGKGYCGSIRILRLSIRRLSAIRVARRKGSDDRQNGKEKWDWTKTHHKGSLLVPRKIRGLRVITESVKKHDHGYS